jgi:tRNA U34 5-methylaminomethyl-2-thiouridine-forming methyltransferase MnmC
VQELIISNDGSHTVFSKRFQVTYHSKYGSIQESNTVFINAGLEFLAVEKKKISIFEMGFGTGLNALLSYLYAKEKDIQLSYVGVEAYPLSQDEVSLLNYPDVLSLDNFDRQFFKDLHFQKKGSSLNFNYQIIHDKIENINFPECYDLIYYDAFAPSSQEELWTIQMMQKMYSFLKSGGVLTSYCAKGQFKRNLREAGFRVEALPGPIGKREMTRALKV